MQIAFFSAATYDRPWFERYAGTHQFHFFAEPLRPQTASLAAGCGAACAFVHDDLSRPTLEALARQGVGLIALRCSGADHVDQAAARELGLTVLNVPGYSPASVAEHALGLLLALLRHLPEAHRRVRAGNFSLDGLTGTTLHGKTVGVIGTGHIGGAFCRMLSGFGCKRLAYDVHPTEKILRQGVRYVPLPALLREADVVALHCALHAPTHHLLNAQTLREMKPTAVLVNTGRGGLVDTAAVLDALDGGTLAGYAADVYEAERGWFHHDHSGQPLTDPLLDRLRQHPHVLLTAHQGFLTDEALHRIASTLMLQISHYESGQLAALTEAFQR